MSDLARARELAHAALASLERSRERIDDLNVYPVPDGDTGTNMTMTARAVVEELDQTNTDERLALVKQVTRAALMGARGNSGVILSQIVRGAAEPLGLNGNVDTETLARSFRSASDAAYRAVREPVEGTMLSVIRELAEEAEQHTGSTNADLLAAVVRRGEEAVERTPEQLAVLREAGVVDAGGAGLLELVRGLAAAVAGVELPPAPPQREELGVEAIHQELSRYRYCTTFMIEGDGLDADTIEGELEQLGDSLLVVGDRETLKVHVHTDEPGRALAVGTGAGVIDRVEIANMHEQTVQREERLLEAVPDAPSAQSAVVAVVAGEGNKRLFESFGARVVEGGQSMNPSVGELSEPLDSGVAPEFIILPNNANVIRTAEQAAYHAEVNALVLPTRSMQEGLSALVAFDPLEFADKNLQAMREVVDSMVTGEVTIAARDARLKGLSIEAGDYLGLAAEEAVATGSTFDDVAWAVVERLLSQPKVVLTLLTGADAPDLDGLLDRIRAGHPDLELEVQAGGQPHYPLLLSAE